MKGAHELEDFIRELTTGLEELRARLGSWTETGPSQAHEAVRGGVTAESSLHAGLVSLRIDQPWLERADLDEVGRCIVEAVNASEDASRAAVWSSLGDIRLGGVSVADLGAPAAQERLRTAPGDVIADLVPPVTAKESS